MDTEKVEKTGPKVYKNDAGEDCFGFSVKVLFPVGILAMMREKGEYETDSMPRQFVSGIIDSAFATHVAEFEQRIDGPALVTEFLAKPDGRKDRKAQSEKISTLESEVARLRAALATHVSPPNAYGVAEPFVAGK